MPTSNLLHRTKKEILKDIKKHPENHHHKDVKELLHCCTVQGVFHSSLVEAHGQYAPIRKNENGKNCDVVSGACACGKKH